jgi:hypothetical protein
MSERSTKEKGRVLSLPDSVLAEAAMLVALSPEADRSWLESKEAGDILSRLVPKLVEEMRGAAVTQRADASKELGVSSVMHDGEGLP